MIIKITKAGAVSGNVIEDVCIEISGEISEFVDLKDAVNFYGEQSALLADILMRSLPGGTLDLLLANLMQKRASLLIIPLPVKP